jgi:hypothetical protein
MTPWSLAIDQAFRPIKSILPARVKEWIKSQLTPQAGTAAARPRDSGHRFE